MVWWGRRGQGKNAVRSPGDAFGQAYGVLIKELRLLARSIFVVDKDGVVQYVHHVKEVSQEPDYGAVIASVRRLV